MRPSVHHTWPLIVSKDILQRSLAAKQTLAEKAYDWPAIGDKLRAMLRLNGDNQPIRKVMYRLIATSIG